MKPETSIGLLCEKHAIYDSLSSSLGAGTTSVINDQYEQHKYEGMKITVNRKTRRI